MIIEQEKPGKAKTIETGRKHVCMCVGSECMCSAVLDHLKEKRA